jgi:hypothetical protein
VQNWDDASLVEDIATALADVLRKQGKLPGRLVRPHCTCLSPMLLMAQGLDCA